MRFVWVLLVCMATIFAQESLTVPKIMQAEWPGSLPSGIRWSDNSDKIFFYWNPQRQAQEALYCVAVDSVEPVLATEQEMRAILANSVYTRARDAKVYVQSGCLFIWHSQESQPVCVLAQSEDVSEPRFSHDERKVIFWWRNNLHWWQRETGLFEQLTDFRRGVAPSASKESEADRWLKEQERQLFQVWQNPQPARAEPFHQSRPLTIYAGDKQVRGVQLSPDERFITFRLEAEPVATETQVPRYVTEHGAVDSFPARSKVVTQRNFGSRFGIYDRQQQSVRYVAYDMPGIDEQPQYLREYPQRTNLPAREVNVYGPVWSNDGQRAVVVALTIDRKDRWLLNLDCASAKLELIDRQRDEAWIGGPEIIGAGVNPGRIGWLPDNLTIWYHSEVSGYSHIYTSNVVTKQKQAITSGNFEVSASRLAQDGTRWYFTSNMVHPGERHFYHLSVGATTPVAITKQSGQYQAYLSPDEKWLALLYSYSNRPWELFVMPNTPGATPKQITRSLHPDFMKYPWRDPQVITFSARDQAQVYARLYLPASQIANGAAVIFVHGAGYLQNAHKGWSSYTREYMFHNLLADKGYTVLDIDYRGSAGYGRDWRTGIYRHMGGKDLTDHVDGAKFLVEKYGIDAKRIGIYGGSYGGFITLMALFCEPEIFAAGAALRAVSDFAHYNHIYTANILNEPLLDPIAYRRSSPIYFAEGLTKPLLICHGMVDGNVHFQDVVRLAQRLIELGKEDWEMAIYPIEDHAFQQPSSWTDEYRRILKLFEQHLQKR